MCLCMYEHPENEPVWVIDEVGPLPVSALQWIRVTGREVHIRRRSNFNPGSLSLQHMEDPIMKTLNPRRFLAHEDIWRLRLLFPDISGIRLQPSPRGAMFSTDSHTTIRPSSRRECHPHPFRPPWFSQRQTVQGNGQAASPTWDWLTTLPGSFPPTPPPSPS